MRTSTLIVVAAVLVSGCFTDTDTPEGVSLSPPEDRRPIALATPTLTLSFGIEDGYSVLKWSSSPNADWYTVEADMSPEFATSTVVHTGPELTYPLGYPSEYLFTSYYRVRAENRDSISEWSDWIGFP